MSLTTVAISSSSSTGNTIFYLSLISVFDDQRFTALLTLRVTALYRRVRWSAPLLWIAFVLFQGLRVSMQTLGTVALFGKVASQ